MLILALIFVAVGSAGAGYAQGRWVAEQQLDLLRDTEG